MSLTSRYFLTVNDFSKDGQFLFPHNASQHKTLWYILFYIKRNVKARNNWLLKYRGSIMYVEVRARCHSAGAADGCRR